VRPIIGLIVAVIGVYIGIALIPGINTTVATITTPTYSVGVVGIVGVVLIVVAAAIVLMILNSTGFGG